MPPRIWWPLKTKEKTGLWVILDLFIDLHWVRMACCTSKILYTYVKLSRKDVLLRGIWMMMVLLLGCIHSVAEM